MRNWKKSMSLALMAAIVILGAYQTEAAQARQLDTQKSAKHDIAPGEQAGRVALVDVCALMEYWTDVYNTEKAIMARFGEALDECRKEHGVSTLGDDVEECSYLSMYKTQAATNMMDAMLKAQSYMVRCSKL